MIIVEGPDGSGKTNLANHLAERYNIPIADKVVDSDTKPMIDDLREWVEKNLAKGSQRMIFDRHRLISEPIYQAAMCRPPQSGFDEITWLTGKLLKFYSIRPFIVYCLPAYTQVHNNLIGDEHNVVVQQYLPYIYPAYANRAAIDIAAGRAVHYDYNHGPERIDMLFDRWMKVKRFEHDKAGG